MSNKDNIVAHTCIIVLGMHRSGTSALSGVLSLLGAHPGESLMPAAKDVNPKGFWEHAEIVSLHDKLLEYFDSSWNDTSPLPDRWWLSNYSIEIRNQIINVLRRDFSNLSIWLIKDPRMCRLLPIWDEIFSELSCKPYFAITLRNPVEIAQSLHKRDGLPNEVSCLLWLTYMLEAEFQTRGKPRIFINYTNLLIDWHGTIASISKNLNLIWPITVEEAAKNIDDYLDPSLRHYANSYSLSDHLACHLAQQVFALLSAPTLNDAELDRLRLQTDELVNLVTPWSKQLRQSDLQLNKLKNQNLLYESKNSELQMEIARIKSTFSWRVTSPLRVIWNWTCRVCK